MAALAVKTHFGAELIRDDGTVVALNHYECNALRAAFGAPPTVEGFVGEHLQRHQRLAGMKVHAPGCPAGNAPISTGVCTCGAAT